VLGSSRCAEFLGTSSGSKLFVYGLSVVLGGLRVKLSSISVEKSIF